MNQLDVPGLETLSADETKRVNGGGFFGDFLKAEVVFAAKYLINYFFHITI